MSFRRNYEPGEADRSGEAVVVGRDCIWVRRAAGIDNRIGDLIHHRLSTARTGPTQIRCELGLCGMPHPIHDLH